MLSKLESVDELCHGEEQDEDDHQLLHDVQTRRLKVVLCIQGERK